LIHQPLPPRPRKERVELIHRLVVIVHITHHGLDEFGVPRSEVGENA
jgi:hypothetical protein